MIKVFTRFWKLSNVRLVAAVLSMALLSNVAFAQGQQISGKVLDETGAGLPGASVLIKGTSTGTVTDMDGKFSLNAKPSDVLVISFIGYEAQTLTVGSQTTFDLSLELDADQLDEVVVTGYSTDSRRETAGSVSTVSSKSLTVAPSGNVEQMLQGRVAGVTVISNGQPGTTSQVRIRGYGSLGGNAPLYVVDGVSVLGGVDYINPDDIESTTVLKDAAAASIYGARAANGVIVISTKKGKKGSQPLTVEYNGMIGVTTPGNGIEMLTPEEHAEYTWKAIRNAATNQTFSNNRDLDATNNAAVTPVFNHPQYGTGQNPVVPDYLKVGNATGVVGSVTLSDHDALYNVDPVNGAYYQVVKANKAGTDWYDAISGNARLNRHHIGIRGGGESSSYYVGLGMQEQEGIILGSKLQRYTLRANTEFDLNSKLRIGQNLQGTYRATRNLLGEDGGSGSSDDENIMLSTLRMPNIIPVHDEYGGYAGTAVGGFNNPANPVAVLQGARNDRSFDAVVMGNVFLEFEPIKDLIFRTNFGGGYGNSNGRNYSRRTYENSENNGAFGFSQRHSYGYNWQFTNTISYKKKFGLHGINLLVGQESMNIGTGRGMSAGGIDPFSQSVDYVSLGNVGNKTVGGGHSNGINFSSYFGKVKYDLDDKYMAEFVVRRDGSSRFGSQSRYGVFPAAAVAWRISSESFMSGISAIDDMKIRAGYGIMGNSNNVNPDNQFNIFSTNVGASSYDLNGTNSGALPGYYRSRIGNVAAQWEKSITQNLGVDLMMFGGKIDVVLDIWKRTTEQMLYQAPNSVMKGTYAAVPSVNVGEMENKGIDLKIVNKGNITSDLKYEATFNGGFLKNKIVKLAEGIDYLSGGGAYRGIEPTRMDLGSTMSTFYGLDVAGIWQNAAEVDAANTAARAVFLADPANAAIAADPTDADNAAAINAVVYQADAAPGRFKFVDVNGDGFVNTDDRKDLGNPVPKFTGGITLKLMYKSFELEAYGYASLGNKIYNMTKLFTDFYPLFPGANISARAKQTWSSENPTGDIPIFENAANYSTMTQSSSYFVEDGSYFRLQNVTLTYILPETLLNTLSMKEIRVFAGVNNLVTISKYSGLDPSVGGSADTNFGIDLGNFPITRSFTLGVKARF